MIIVIKLIKLEWKKYNNGNGLITAALIMTAILALFIVGTAGELHSAETVEIYGKSMIDAAVDIFTHISYIIFTGVMLAIFLVGAYEKRTINLMFSYPIKRRKIMLSKVLAVWIFNYIALVISKLLLYAVLLTTKSFTHLSAADIPMGSLTFWLNLFLSSAAMVSIAFIALPIGLKFRSSKAAIVAAVIIACLTQGNIGSFTLADSVPFYGFLFLLAAVSVVLTVYDVETKDVM
ncbi:MAG: ABC transporter permease subunit [Lachnospiraceae bacterium]|nr:ABC transporter permease subunit [Lachnospiraceae bacterium]